MIDAPAEEPGACLSLPTQHRGIIWSPEANPEAAPVDGAESSSKGTKGKKVWTAPRVKTLTEEDLGKYTIFDVIMPLPGNDVAYPTGPLGERYREFLKLDGLDPDNFVRKQK